MTEKNIFAYKLFLALNISDFNSFFIWESQPPLKKVTPSFPATLSKSCGPVKAPFLTIWLEAQPPPPPLWRKGGCTLCIKTLRSLHSWSFFFFVAATFTTPWLALRPLRPGSEKRHFSFHFSTTFTTSWSRLKKNLFWFQQYVPYAIRSVVL